MTVLINEGAKVEGDVVADELTIAGRVKGTIHANRVKLNSTAVVEGDIFHRSLSIEENARFEGSSKREENAVDVPRTHCGARQPRMISRQKSQSRAVGNPMGHQAMTDTLTRELRSRTEGHGRPTWGHSRRFRRAAGTPFCLRLRMYCCIVTKRKTTETLQSWVLPLNLDTASRARPSQPVSSKRLY